MKNIIIVVCCLSLALNVIAQKKLPTGATPISYTAFLKKGMEKTDGILPVYRQGEKYYLEVPDSLLGRDFLFLAQSVKGSGGSGVFLKSLGIASFRKFNGHKLALCQDICSERLSDTSASLESEFLQPVEYLYPIITYGADKNSSVIEITTLIKNGKDWFTLSNFASGSEADVSSVDSVQRIPDGVKFKVTRIHSYGAKARLGQKGYVPAEIEFTLRVLPRERMQARLADRRVGYQASDYWEYDLATGNVDKVSVIHRWNLEKEPLVFTLAPYIPYEVRTAIRKGISGWQQAFTEAGLPDAIQIREADSTEDLTQVRILVTFSTLGGDVTSSMITDPRTGEILSGRLNVPHSTPARLLRNYMLQCGATDHRILINPNDSDIVSELISWQVARKVGSLLGLVENRVGSAAYTTKQLRDKDWLAKHGCTASVMDECCLNYVAQPEDKVDVKDLIPRVGEYDRWAIRYGYMPLKGSPREVKQLLNPLLAEASANSALRYMPANEDNPYTQGNDLASDKVNAARYGMRNLARMMPELEKLSGVEDKDNWDMLKMAWLMIGKQYERYLKDVVSLIGGQMQTPVIRGYNEVPLTYVSKKEQQEAMEFLNQYLFSGVPTWMDYRLAERRGWLTGTDIVKQVGQVVLRSLFKQRKIELLLAAQQAGENKNYGVQDLFGDLNRMIYHDFDGSMSGKFPRMMQHLYTANWVGSTLTGEINTLQNDYAMVSLAELTRFRKNLEHLSRVHSGKAERDLYRMMVANIDRTINVDGRALKEALKSVLK